MRPDDGRSGSGGGATKRRCGEVWMDWDEVLVCVFMAGISIAHAAGECKLLWQLDRVRPPTLKTQVRAYFFNRKVPPIARRF